MSKEFIEFVRTALGLKEDEELDEGKLEKFVEGRLFHCATQNVQYKGNIYSTYWKPGCCMGAYLTDEPLGPRNPAEVMVISDWCDPVISSECSYEDWSSTLEPIMASVELGDTRSWYFTNLVKFSAAFYTQSTIPAAWYKACRPWLEEELKRVQPKYVLCLGGPVAKCVMDVGTISIEEALGAAYPIKFECEDGTVIEFEVIVLPAVRSLNENRGSARSRSLLKHQLEFLRCKMQGIQPDVPRHLYVDNAKDLKAEIERIQNLAKEDPKRKILAVDLEWEGDHPGQKDAKVLTVQFSSAPGEATVVVLNHNENGQIVPAFKPSQKQAIKLLNDLLTWHDDWQPRVGGHFLRADLPWLIDLGITGTEPQKDIRFSYQAVKDVKLARWFGGWDTSLMYHAYNEKESYGLKYLAAKELNTPRYEVELNNFIENYLKENKLRKKDLHGYGCVPDEILWPYAAWDADVTRRLAELCMFGMNGRPALLDCDAVGRDNWVPYHLAQRANLGFLEIEQGGLLLDTNRYHTLSLLFSDAYNVLLNKLRTEINWPDFNPASTPQKQGLLYGHQYAMQHTKNGDKCMMPEDAITLGLTPEYATKTRQSWKDLEEADRRGDIDISLFSPSADKTVLNLLAQKSDVVSLFRDVCKLKTVLSSPLSVPTSVWTPDGLQIQYNSGLSTCLWEDGAIHTHIRTLLATGRASSSNPNLQNIGKSAEATFQRILGYVDEDGNPVGDYLDDFRGKALYKYPVRTVLRARPDHVFIESDFTGAELAVMAWISGDPAMIEHVRRNALPESDPDYYDIHSHIAVKAFHLDCEPTKKGLASIHKKHLRVAAKSVVFGIPFDKRGGIQSV